MPVSCITTILKNISFEWLSRYFLTQNGGGWSAVKYVWSYDPYNLKKKKQKRKKRKQKKILLCCLHCVAAFRAKIRVLLVQSCWDRGGILWEGCQHFIDLLKLESVCVLEFFFFKKLYLFKKRNFISTKFWILFGSEIIYWCCLLCLFDLNDLNTKDHTF